MIPGSNKNQKDSTKPQDKFLEKTGKKKWTNFWQGYLRKIFK